jgi:pimeloyl-ACP methyl ester carboxylesterase
MDPRIRYAPTADGVSIAFWTLGEGVPLVYMAGGPWGHVELWDISECRRWYERLAQKRMLVRYDVRGTGWSEREVSDHSLDALVADVEAVVDRLGLDRFGMFGAFDAGPVAIAYAARHPGRVSHLILWCSWARTSDIRSPRIRAWLGLLDQDWELMTDTCAHLALGWPAGETGRHAAQRLRESMTPEVARAALEAMSKFDVTALLPALEAPTLVLHRSDIPRLPSGIARSLTSRIPDARLRVLEGESTAPYLGDTEAAASAIEEFLGVELEGRTLFAWCALDALLFPVLLERPASIKSSCRGTGEAVHIEVTPAGIEMVEPPSAVVSIVAARDLANIRSVDCNNTRFLSSLEAASRWLERHPQATILPAEAAFRLGRLIAEGLLDISRLAEPTDAEHERTSRVDEH